jgi:uncharacterized protein
MSDPDPADIEPTTESIRPTGERERIVTLDVLRGLAIFGILFVNIGMFSFPEGYAAIHRELFGGASDRFVHWAIVFLIEGKFYSIFSVLFGIGAAIQFEKARRRGRKFGPWYARRLLVLLAIGFVHDVFVAPGIILLTYSIVGFWLLPFFKRRSRTLFVWTGVMILIPVLVVSVFIVVRSAGEDEGAPEVANEATDSEQVSPEKRQLFEREIEMYSRGTYLDLVRVRAGKLVESIGITLALGWYVLAMFLIGLLLWRSGWIADPETHRAELKKVLVLGLSVGAVCTGGYVAVRMAVTSTPSPAVLVPAVTAQMVGNMALCLGYMAAVVLAMTTRPGRRLLSPLAPVGRAALSNYLFQNLVCTAIFYNHGFGLFGKVGPGHNLLIVFAVFAVQLLLSTWWVRRFRFGPVEWVWRSLTYQRRFTIRRTDR